MTISGYDCWKRKGLSRRWKLENVGAETTFSGSPFQIRGLEMLKVRLPTLDSRNIGTTRRLELAEPIDCSDLLLGRRSCIGCALVYCMYSLPPSVTSAPSLTVFKRQLKTFLLDNFFF